MMRLATPDNCKYDEFYQGQKIYTTMIDDDRQLQPLQYEPSDPGPNCPGPNLQGCQRGLKNINESKFSLKYR